jgi:hypothetical protein
MYKSTGKIGEIEFRFSPSIDKLIYEKKIKEGKLDVNEAFASAAEKIKAGVNLLIMSADKINKIEEIHRFDKKLNMHDLAGRSGMFSGRLNDFAKSEKMTALSASFQGKTANQLVAV